MSARGIVRGLGAALGYLYHEWRPEWRPARWFDKPDERFVLEAMDRPARQRLIASLSDQRLGLLWVCLLVIVLFFFMGGGTAGYGSMYLFLLCWLQLERLDGRIKLLKLVDRMPSAEPAPKTL